MKMVTVTVKIGLTENDQRTTLLRTGLSVECFCIFVYFRCFIVVKSLASSCFVL